MCVPANICTNEPALFLIKCIFLLTGSNGADTMHDVMEHNALLQSHAGNRRLEGMQVGQHLPKALTVTDLCRAFGFSRQTFYRRAALGEFRPFELARPIGRRRYSGEKVQAFLNGRK